MSKSIKIRNNAIGIIALLLSFAGSGIAYQISQKDTGPSELDVSEMQSSHLNECVRLGTHRGFEAHQESGTLTFSKSRDDVSGGASELVSMIAIDNFCRGISVTDACMGEECADDIEDKELPYADAFFRFSMSLPGEL